MDKIIGQQFILKKEELTPHGKRHIDKYGIYWSQAMINHVHTIVTIVGNGKRYRDRYKIEIKSGDQYYVHKNSLEPLNIYDI